MTVLAYQENSQIKNTAASIENNTAATTQFCLLDLLIILLYQKNAPHGGVQERRQ